MRNTVPHFTGVPCFFRGCCHTARQGGDCGYQTAGRELMRHYRSLAPHEYCDQEWSEICDQLDTAIAAGDLKTAEAWFVARYPLCMALVPKRRRGSFMKGVTEMAVRYDIVQADNE